MPLPVCVRTVWFCVCARTRACTRLHSQGAEIGGVRAQVFDNNQFLGAPFNSFISSKLEMANADLSVPISFSVRYV